MRMNSVHLTVLAFCGIQFAYCTQGVINVDHLVAQYTLGCGHNNLCTFLSAIPYYFRALDRCPRCSCEDNCFESGNCCPDVFFRRKYKVFTNFVIGSAKDHDAESYDKYEVITHCPAGALSTLKAICESSAPVEVMINNPPVTSLSTNNSYSNTYCAQCHGETLDDLVNWNMGMGKGNIPLEVNFISPFAELMKFGEILEIPFLFTPPTVVKDIVRTKPVKYILPSTCPDNTDRDIKMACESSYFLPFRFYQNIFCYICNIRKPNIYKPSIDICNVTGQWDANDLALKRECIERESSPLSYPYKNFYCFLCNTISDPTGNLKPGELQVNVIHFYDSSFVYEESHRYDWKKQEIHELKVKNIVFRNQMMYNTIVKTKVENSEEASITEGWILRKGQLIDMRGLIQKKVAMYPDRVCDKMLLPASVRDVTPRNCECGIDCVFKNVCSCCVDTALKSSVSCNSDSVQSAPIYDRSEGKIIAIESCSENEEYSFFHKYRKLCEMNTGDYSSHFVTNGSATFKNVFCFFCNTKLYRINTKLLHDPFSPFDLNIICPTFFHFLFAGSINDVIRLAKAEGCAIFFDTDKAKRCKEKEDDNFYGGGFASNLYFYDFIDGNDVNEENKIIETCNNSGSMANEIDVHVQWACENVSDQAFPSLSGFKNEFCLLCNANNSIETVNNTCPFSEGNSFLDIYSGGCQDLPELMGRTEIQPYKNSFCYACNNVNCTQSTQLCFPNSPFVVDTGECSRVSGSSTRIRPHYALPKYSPSYDFYASPKDETKSNRHGCYPGRVLVTDICELIITEAESILYGFDISLLIAIENATHENTNITLLEIEATLEANIVKFFPISPAMHSSFYLLPHKNSSLPTESPIINFKMRADLYFEVRFADFDRRYVETSIMLFPYSIDERFSVKTTQLNYEVKGMGFSSPKHSVANSDPSLMKSILFREKMSDYFQQPPGVLVLVNRLLICVQRRLNSSLFVFDKENLEIVSNETKTKYGMGEFVLDFNGFFGVCDPSFRYTSVKKAASFDFTNISYLPTIFNGISTVCVASAFLGFCFFKSLRTPSGVNSIVASFFLFGFHVLSLQVKLLEHIKTSCLLTGIGLHYLWLSISFSACVAIVHHFSLLKNSKEQNQEPPKGTKQISLIQILCSVLVPIFIVGLNTALLYALSDKGVDFYYSDKCFLSHQLSYILTFLTPSALAAMVTIFFIYLGLKRVANLTEKMNRQKRGEFFISLKIAVLVCLFVSLQVSEFFVNTPVYSFVVELIVSTFGCSLFLAFCCSSQLCRQNDGKGSMSDSGSNQSLAEEKVEKVATTNVETQ